MESCAVFSLKVDVESLSPFFHFVTKCAQIIATIPNAGWRVVIVIPTPMGIEKPNALGIAAASFYEVAEVSEVPNKRYSG